MRGGEDMVLWQGLQQIHDAIRHVRVSDEGITTTLSGPAGRLGHVALEPVRSLHAAWSNAPSARKDTLAESLAAWTSCEGAIREVQLSESSTDSAPYASAIFFGAAGGAFTARRPVIDIKVGFPAGARRITTASIGLGTEDKERRAFAMGAEWRYDEAEIALAQGGQIGEIHQRLQPLATGRLLLGCAVALDELRRPRR